MRNDEVLWHPALELTEAEVEELLRWAFEGSARAEASALDLAARSSNSSAPVLIRREVLPRPFTLQLHNDREPPVLTITADDPWFANRPFLCDWQSASSSFRALVILEYDTQRKRAFGEIALSSKVSSLPNFSCPLLPEDADPEMYLDLYDSADPTLRPAPSTFAAHLEKILPPRALARWEPVIAQLRARDS